MPLSRIHHFSPTLQGIIWIVISCFWFAGMMGIVRYLSTPPHDLHPFVMVFCRNLFAMIGMLPWLARVGLGQLRSGKLALHAARATTGVSAMLLWFYALTVFPLSEAVALSFTVPLLTTLAAILFLKEKVGIHRWSAIITGFIGMLIVLRPGTSTFDPAALIILLTACIWALSNILIKKMSHTESPRVIVFYMLLFMTPISLPFAIPYFQIPSLEEFFWLVVMAIMSNFGQIALSTAISKCDMSILAPFDFARLVFVSIIAYVVFNETIDIHTVIGSIVITVSAVYIARREALARPTSHH